MDFSAQSGIDVGAIQLNEAALRIARGQKNTGTRNTMVSVFEYAKK